MKIMCAFCENEVGNYEAKVKGKAIDHQEINKSKLDITCKNKTSIFGDEVILPNVDPAIYSVRPKQEIKCNKRLRSFHIRGGVLWGM